MTESESSKKQNSTLITHILTVTCSMMAGLNFLQIYSHKKESNFRGEGEGKKKKRVAFLHFFNMQKLLHLHGIQLPKEREGDKRVNFHCGT